MSKSAVDAPEALGDSFAADASPPRHVNETATQSLGNGSRRDAAPSPGTPSADMGLVEPRKMELLAPAGGWEQMEFAIRFGADAVYLACERFGMRARADNFKAEELESVVSYAHERGTSVHVACNTAMYEADLPLLPSFFETVQASGADAVIVGDMGALRLARQHASRVDIHVSTQASVSNAQAALAYHELGARRIVCAREMSLDDIRSMRAQLPDDLELEVFVHGSMCMAVSGRCLISDHMTDRSGVAGNCAQPCRWKYALVEETRPGQYFGVEEDGRGTYIMNAKDLCMLKHLDALRDAGVNAVKIEGRNKKAFYVATVVNAYRQVLDGTDPTAFVCELDTVSHRPYSTGFFFGPAYQTEEDDRYTRNYHWAFEAVDSAVLPNGGIADAALSSGGTLAPCADLGTGLSPLGSAAGLSHAPDDSSLTREQPVGALGTSETLAGSLTTCDSDAGGETYTVTGLCRNRFAEGDVLEVLSPHAPVRSCTVRDLRYVGTSPDHPGFPPADDVFPGPVSVANRTMELYSFAIPFEAHPHDIFRIRAKTGERSQKLA